MVQELDDQQASMGETINPGINLVIIKNWDGTVETLQRQPGLESTASQMGFDLPTLVATLNSQFSEGLTSHPEYNAVREKTEDVVAETIMVNNRPLDRLLVTAYQPAANPNPAEMTKFKSGGEVILITDGEAEITFAPKMIGDSISRSDLKTERVGKGDLIISTDTPNNWTRVDGEKFSFIYFVGNPNGPQRYGDIPKEKIPLK